MILTGDVNLRNFADPRKPFALVADALGSADVVYGNLENCFYDSTVPIPFKGQWLHTATALAPALKEAGFHAVGCANNVTYGADAILSTLALLDEMEIEHTGAGRDIASARAPVVIERDGVRFGFIQRTSVFWPIGHEATDTDPGVAALKAHTAYQPNVRIAEMPGGPPVVVTWPDAEHLDGYLAEVQALRKRVGFLVASFHWGISGSFETADYQVALAHAAIDAGADLVMGHGPHEVQAIEIYKDKPVFYSLGNFLFKYPDWVGLTVTVDLEDGKMAQTTCSLVRPNADDQVEISKPGHESE